MDPGLPWRVMPFCWLTPGTGSLPVLKDLLGKMEGADRSIPCGTGALILFQSDC